MVDQFVGDMFHDSPRYETFLCPMAADYRIFGPNAVADRMFGIKKALLNRGFGLCPDAVYTEGVIALIVKNHTEDALDAELVRKSLLLCKRVCEYEEIRHLALIPGLMIDRTLIWTQTKAIIDEVFGVEIHVSAYFRAEKGGA